MQEILSLTEDSVFWDVTPCRLVEVYWYFGGTYHPYILGQRAEHASSNK
jgi:hypothetical protein